MATQLKSNLNNLKSKVKGAVLVPGDSTYDEARTVWNAMVDRKPP